jgi:uridine kinase
VTTPDLAPAGRVVVLAGPSGSGKSRLADRLSRTHGWPIVRLDDFYREADHPGLPRSADLGIVDWDHPDSWDAAAAVECVATLCRTGATSMPVYDISSSSVVGSRSVSVEVHQLVLCEGIFAAEIIGPLAVRGLLHSAWCVHHAPPVTFAWRLARDLRERRKPPAVLLRRGLALMRAERGVVARQLSLGARPARPTTVERTLSSTALRAGPASG